VILVHSTVVPVLLTILAVIGLRVLFARLRGISVFALILPRRRRWLPVTCDSDA
jgi:hypothetical protein